MMNGISIRYMYDGDEATWETAVNAFIEAINTDADISGKFSYAVSTAADGVLRSHTGRWDSEETLNILRSRDYFKTFASTLQDMAGETLDAKQIGLYRETD